MAAFGQTYKTEVLSTGFVVTQLPPYTFNRSAAERWATSIETDSGGNEGVRICGRIEEQKNNSGTLSFATYNVWFSFHEQQTRYRALISILQSTNSDFVCLQEVTTPFLFLLLQQPWVRHHYTVSHTQTGQFGGGYGVVMLVRSSLPLLGFYQYQLPTSQTRQLLVAELCINNQLVRVGTVHLESMATNGQTRQSQLKLAFHYLLTASPSLSSPECNQLSAFIMGDFNFCSSWKAEEQTIKESPFTDLWADVFPLSCGARGFTEDSDVNIMLFNDKQKAKRVRFDRILCAQVDWPHEKGLVDGGRSAGGAVTENQQKQDLQRDTRKTRGWWVTNHASLLGTQAIRNTTPPLSVWPSDHFGVFACARYEISQETNKSDHSRSPFGSHASDASDDVELRLPSFISSGGSPLPVYFFGELENKCTETEAIESDDSCIQTEEYVAHFSS